MSCPQIWKIEKEEYRKKGKVGRQASEAQREKELERERKSKRRHFLLEEQNEVLWQRDAGGHPGENESEQEHVRHSLHKTCN